MTVGSDLTNPSEPTLPSADAPVTVIDFAISGMTCAACANRIERKLNKVAGVSASVNYATEKARVSVPVSMTSDEVIDVVRRAGYDAVALRDESESQVDVDDVAALRRRTLLAAALALPVIVWAMVPAWQFVGWQWASLVLATPVVTWAAYPFHRAALVNLRHGATTMDTLVSLGTTSAFVWSVIALVWGSAGTLGMTHGFEMQLGRTDPLGNVYFEVAAGVTTFLLAGRWFEKRSKRRAGLALTALMELAPSSVSLLRDGREEQVSIEQLAVGDLFIVRPGEKVATDGEIVEGTSSVDVSMLTGEPIPVDLAPGDEITGACLNGHGRLVVRATRVGADTQLARLARLVEEAQTGKAEVQRLADRISAVFVPAVIGLAVVTLGFWWGAGAGAAMAVGSAVAVLIVACPCALGLATPTALMVGTGRGAQLGIVIKGPQILESTRRVDTIVLDKTGTVTTGEMTVAEVTAAHGEDPESVRRVAAAVEAGSEHPIGRAIAGLERLPSRRSLGDLLRTGAGARSSTDVETVVEEGEERARLETTQPTLTAFVALEGLGVAGRIHDRLGELDVVVGRAQLLAQRGIDIPEVLSRALTQAQAVGHTAVVVAWDGVARGVIAVADTIKPTSADAVRQLRELGLRPVLLTGDHAAAAKQVADAVGIDEVVSEVLPHEKVATVTRLQQQGRVVAMVGDGINDAPALATADLGLAMGTGTGVAIEASDVTLVGGDLRSAATAIRLSRRTLRTIKTNLVWAFGYNVAALPLAATGLLNPMIAGAAMALSSVFVVTNSLRLRSFR